MPSIQFIVLLAFKSLLFKNFLRVSHKAQKTQTVPLSFPSFPAPDLGTFLNRSVICDIPAVKECRGHRFFFLLH